MLNAIEDVGIFNFSIYPNAEKEYRAAEISSAPSNSFTLSREGGNDDGMVCESEETKRNTTQSDKETHAVQEAEKIL